MRTDPHIVPDLSPTPLLAYIAGVIVGDGCAHHDKKCRSYALILNVTEKKFAQSFLDALKSIGLNPSIRLAKRKRPEKNHWYVRGRSKTAYYWAKGLSTQALKELASLTLSHSYAFLRGFYESEGTFISKGFYIQMRNTKRTLIFLVKSVLEEIGLRPKVSGPYKQRKGKSPIYVLGLYYEKDVRIFFEKTKPCIKQMTEKQLTKEQKMRVQAYFRALELKKQGLGCRRISRLVSIPERTISGWISGRYKPRVLAAREY